MLLLLLGVDMGQFWVWLWTFLITAIGPLIAEAFRILGVGIVTYIGSDLLIDQLEAKVVSMLSESPASVLQILSMAGLDEAMSIILSGLAIEASLRVTNGRRSKFILKA